MRWGLVAGALVGAASAGAAPLGCAEPSPDIAERSPAFRTEVEIARGDEPANLLDTDDAPCGPRHDGAGPASSLPSVGAALALTEVAGRRVALIADADAQQLRRLALDDAEELPATPLPGAPSALAIGEDGRIFVTLRDVHRVAVLEAGHDVGAPLELRCTRPTPREPVGLATYPGGLAVTSRWGQSLTLFDRDDTMKRQRVVGLPRDPQAVVVTEAGKAVVSHAFGGRLSLVDLKTGERRERKLTRREKMDGASVDHIDRIGNQAFVLVPLGQDDFALPNVMVDAGDNRTVASTAYYGGTAEVPIAVPLVARIDGRRDQVLVSTNNPARRCLLPKAATYDAAEDLVLVGCTGVDEVVALRRGKGRDRVHDELAWQAPLVGAPTALAVDAASHRLVAWSQFDATVTVVSLDRREERQVHRLTPAADLDPIIAAGRKIFHEAGKTRLAFDGRACASCHPDGRDDAVTWATPKGPRQTPMLVDRLEDTAPFGWDGSRGDLHGYVRGTLRRLGGDGLSGRDRAALIAYLMSLKAPTEPAPLTPREKRGADLFASSATGCTGCHAGTGMTDRMGHDVGSTAPGDEAGEFDTPSLRHLAQSAPYYHDGRYPSLQAMLSDRHLKMGQVAQLSAEDVDALEAYLRRL